MRKCDNCTIAVATHLVTILDDEDWFFACPDYIKENFDETWNVVRLQDEN